MSVWAARAMETDTKLNEATEEIKWLLKRTALNVMEIGAKLIEVKGWLEYGQFAHWVEAELELSYRTAKRFMEVAEHFSPDIVAELPIMPTALYLLAAPGTIDFARAEALARAGQGERITGKLAQEIIDKYKGVDPFDKNAPPANSEATPTPAQAQAQAMNLITSSSESGWRTPYRYLMAARRVMGQIDLDPASSALANMTVGATDFYTAEENSLGKTWWGRVWLNPPYGKTNNQSNQGLFASKLLAEYMAGRVSEGILLVNLYAGYDWFEPLRTLPMCMTDHRIAFVDPLTDEAGEEAKASSVFVYVGPDPTTFYHVFKEFGPCGQFSYDW